MKKLVIVCGLLGALGACAAQPPQEPANSTMLQQSALFAADSPMPLRLPADNLPYVMAMLVRGELMNAVTNAIIKDAQLPDPPSHFWPARLGSGPDQLTWFWGVNPPDSRSQQMVMLTDGISPQSLAKQLKAVEYFRQGISRQVVPVLMKRMQMPGYYAFGVEDIKAIAPVMNRLQQGYIKQIRAAGPVPATFLVTRFDKVHKTSDLIDQNVDRYATNTAALMAALPSMMWQAAAASPVQPALGSKSGK